MHNYISHFTSHISHLTLYLFLLTLPLTPAVAQDRLYANEFALGDVTLLDGPLKRPAT